MHTVRFSTRFERADRFPEEGGVRCERDQRAAAGYRLEGPAVTR